MLLESRGAVGENNVVPRPLWGDHRLLEPQDSQSQQESPWVRTETLEKPSGANTRESLSYRI